jgi:hypothetical protein
MKVNKPVKNAQIKKIKISSPVISNIMINIIVECPKKLTSEQKAAIDTLF